MAKKLTYAEKTAKDLRAGEVSVYKAAELRRQGLRVNTPTDEERAVSDAAKKETARIKTEEEARIEGVNKALVDATIHPEADELIALRKADADALLKPVKKGRRFSNDDIYELLTSLKADIDKETNIRRGEKPVEGVKLENAPQLVGLVQGLNVVIQRYKIYAKPSKAF